MKKLTILLAVVVLGLVINSTNAEENYIIPAEAVRLRIVANSNSVEDQYVKNEVKKELEQELVKTVKTRNIEEARLSIKNNLDKYKEAVTRTLEKNNYKKEFTINYGNNYFPEKTYKGVTYPAGEYESLLINIGDAKGNNWWCVLFPPLCNLEVEENTTVEYKFLIKEIVKKYI